MPQPTVYAIDDDSFALQLLRQIFSVAQISVETYTSATAFLKRYSPTDPGCILIDMAMPDMSGLELQGALAERGNYTPVIFLSGTSKVQAAVEALRGGAVDFLEKPIDKDDLLRRVEKAMQLDMANRYERLQKANIELKIARLTARESDVLTWLMRGKSNKEIARILDISSRTVESHRRHIIEKMEVHSVVEMAEMVSVLSDPKARIRRTTYPPLRTVTTSYH